jgi:hypothetical protein
MEIVTDGRPLAVIAEVEEEGRLREGEPRYLITLVVL